MLSTYEKRELTKREFKLDQQAREYATAGDNGMQEFCLNELRSVQLRLYGWRRIDSVAEDIEKNIVDDLKEKIDRLENQTSEMAQSELEATKRELQETQDKILRSKVWIKGKAFSNPSDELYERGKSYSRRCKVSYDAAVGIILEEDPILSYAYIML